MTTPSGSAVEPDVHRARYVLAVHEGALDDCADCAPTAPDAALRQRMADAIRAAACTGDCGATEEECVRQRIQPVVWYFGVLAEVSATPEQIATALLPVVAAERAAARADGLREAAEEADRAAGLYAQRGDNDRAGAAFALMERLKAKADGCSFPPCDADEPCAQHEQDPARAAAIHPQDGGQA